jgi:hypothetical protein
MGKERGKAKLSIFGLYMLTMAAMWYILPAGYQAFSVWKILTCAVPGTSVPLIRFLLIWQSL